MRLYGADNVFGHVGPDATITINRVQLRALFLFVAVVVDNPYLWFDLDGGRQVAHELTDDEQAELDNLLGILSVA